MHYAHIRSTACVCHWVFALAVACFALESLFPHAALAQGSGYTAEPATAVRTFPLSADRAPRYVRRILVTAYSSTPDQTDDTPFTTASGTGVRHGVVAANFLPFGTMLRLPDHFGDDVFVVEDRMHQRFSNRLDIWMESRAAARSWGVRYVTIEVF